MLYAIILFYIRLFYLKVLGVLGLISLLTTYTFAPAVIAKPETAVNLAKPDAKQPESGKSESKQSASWKPDSSKPDMQKVYDAAKDWSKDKLDQMPDTKTAHATAGIGVCRGANVGEPLMIKPPCSKKQNQKIDDVVDTAIGQDTAQASETSRNSHPDILLSLKNQAPKILVFVSFSMPKASLRTLCQEAAKHNAVLVIRGLKGDSFKTTQQAFLEIASDSAHKNLDAKAIAKNTHQDMQGFEVNPELFKTYQIKKVPTFVLVKGEQEVSRLSGNVYLSFAAKKLKENL